METLGSEALLDQIENSRSWNVTLRCQLSEPRSPPSGRVSLALELPESHRDSTITAEKAELIELAAHQAAGAVGGDYWVHRATVETSVRPPLKLSTPCVSCFSPRLLHRLAMWQVGNQRIPVFRMRPF
jgi:hypothetical protein